MNSDSDENDDTLDKLSFNLELQKIKNSMIADDILFDIKNITSNYYLCCNIKKDNIIKFIDFVKNI